MIIIKPDLVIKWANSNLVLHRVREHLCVFLRAPAAPYIFIFSEYACDCAWEFECAYALCVCVCVWERERETGCQGKVLRRKGIYIRECLPRHGDWNHLPSGKKEELKKTQTFPHPFSFSSLFSILHSLCSAFSLSLSVSLTKAAVSSKMRPRTEGMQMKSLLVD